MIANNAMDAVHKLGMYLKRELAFPKLFRIPFMASLSNRAYLAINEALSDVKELIPGIYARRNAN